MGISFDCGIPCNSNGEISTIKKFKVTVQDTGPGIPLQESEKIFDPFYTTKFEGAGIGLSISQKIINEHGGTVHFSSDSQGTTFEIYLPAAAEENLHSPSGAKLKEMNFI